MAQQVTEQRKKLLFMVSVGMMAALVFVGNYLQFKIPVSIGDVTRVHLGNSMCLLAGLLFGPGVGGLASGIGAGLYDLFDPVYIVSAPYTFCSKFAMGFLAGLLGRAAFRKEGKSRVLQVILAGVVGQLAYIFLYLLKSYVTLRLVGTASQAAFLAVIPKIAASTVNAVAAVVISVPLSIALRKALSRTAFFSVMNVQKENKGYFNPVTIALTIFCCAVTMVFAMYLSATNKIKAEDQKKIDTLQAQIDDQQAQLDYLAEQLNIELPQPEESSDSSK